MIQVIPAKSNRVTNTDLQRLHEILVHAYAVTEEDMWGKNYVRISFEEFLLLVAQNQVLLAYQGDKVVGGIRFYERSPAIYTFGLLCADFGKSGLGIGSSLIQEVEKMAQKKGAIALEIEILRPAANPGEFKVRLANWYQKLGYRFTRSLNFAEVEPEKGTELITPSVFDYYLKTF